MPAVNFTKRTYKLVEDRNDGLGKVPAFDEEAFQLGITFKAKYVGTLEITRPSCRAEIVTAMRKVRYEFKIKGIQKRRVNITISVDGIKVTVRKRRRRMRKERLLDEEPVVLHEHQIGRIFYVSHDSMDLKIFSYITKDNFDNQFRCSVFKAYRKSKALFVVRTIGQAFEVCHRLQQESGENKEEEKDGKPVEEGVLADTETDIDAVDDEEDKTNDDSLVTDIDKRLNVKPTQTLVEISQLFPPLEPDGKTAPFSVEQLRVLFNQQLEHYIQEREVFNADNQLLKNQLILERNARIRAQEREQFLLQKNRELLQTVQTLANRLQTVNPGDDSLGSALDTPSNCGTIFNPGYPNMYSTPHKRDGFRGQLFDGNSVVTPTIPPPPPDAAMNSESVLATGQPKMAPLAMVENSLDNIQSTVGLYWKTFDEDDIITPGNGFDDSTSESSDDDPFSESFSDQRNLASEKTNGWDDAKLTNGNNVQDIPCGKTLTGAMDAKTHEHNNGLLFNGVQTLPARTENNIFNTNAASSDVRTAIQTDF